MYTCTWVPLEAKGVESPATGVIASCELTNIGARN